MIDTILIGLPSVVESNWKSTGHTRFGAPACCQSRSKSAVFPRQFTTRLGAEVLTVLLWAGVLVRWRLPKRFVGALAS
jgi:hypothetical protein